MKKILLLSIVAAAVASCGRKSGTEGESVPLVKVETVREGGACEPLRYPGRTRAANDYSLSFKVSGTISKIYVSEGQRVRKGDLLAMIDTADYRIQLDATTAEYEQIKGDAERTVRLYEENVTTASNRDKAVYGLRQIQAKLDNHRNQLSYCRLLAPEDGAISSLIFSEGENVSAGLPVLTMLGGKAPEVVINIPASDYVRRSGFGRYSCSFDVYPGVEWPLTLRSVSPKANANQLFSMTFAISPVDGRLPAPGMNTMVTITVGEEGLNRFRVPIGSISRKDGGEKVFVVEDGCLRGREVSVESIGKDGLCTVLSEGIKYGDEVVVSGTSSLREGQKVRILPGTSETNIGGLL